MSDYSLLHSIATEAGKSAPPVAVTGAMIIGDMSISDWVAILTGVYVVLQIIVLVRKERRESQARKQAGEEAP